MRLSNLQSDTIRFLRFPLILGVLYRHASAADIVVQGKDLALNESFYYLDLTQRVFSDILGGVRVPFFFFIAGLLFFRNYQQPDRVFYKKQLHKRVHSLLIPYLFWNCMLMFLFFVAQHTPVLSDLFSGRFTKIEDYGMGDLIKAFGIASRFPISFQFWFLRDLIAVSLSAPLIAYLIRKLKLFPVMLFFICWMCEDRHLMMGSFCFFSLGAYFSITCIDLLSFCNRYRYLFNTLFGAYCVLYLFFPQNAVLGYIGYFSVPGGIFSLFYLASQLLKKIRVPQKWYLLSDMSFFLFAVHEPFLSFLKKSLYITLQPQSEWLLIALFLLPPLFIVVCAYYSYQHIVPYLPTILKQAMGLRPSPVLAVSREVAGKSPKLSTPS